MKGGVIVAKKKVTNGSETIQRTMPALSEEGQEKRMIAAATNLAYEQIMNGTASSQVITHFLKLASSTERLEKKIKEEQAKMLEAKTEQLKSQKNSEEAYMKAVRAMQEYSGHGVEESNEEEEYYEDD